MQIVCCQLDTVWEDKVANFDQVRSLLEGIQVQRDSLIILPEMFATGFSMNAPDLAEPLEDSPTISFLRELALEYQSHLLAGMVIEKNDRFTNDAVLIDSSGTFVGRYAKVHPFTPSGEHDAVSRGSEVVTMPVGDWTIAPFICYDLRFPELFRLAVPEAQLLVVIANWPTPRIDQKIALLKARAIENQAYVIGVNRVGSDPHLDFNGRSVVIDPQGQVVAEADGQARTLVIDLDRQVVADWRQGFPALRDRSPSSLTARHLQPLSSRT